MLPKTSTLKHRELSMKILGLPLVRQSTKTKLLDLLYDCCDEYYNMKHEIDTPTIKSNDSVFVDVCELIRELIAEYNLSPYECPFLPQTTFKDINLSSIDVAEIVAMAEERFNVEFDVSFNPLDIQSLVLEIRKRKK